MTPSKTKRTRFSKKQIILLFVVSIVVVGVGLWCWNQFTPRPLGDKLEYLGKEDYGGWFMRPYSVYSYATDMTSEEIIEYFNKKTELRHPIQKESGGYARIILIDRTSQESATLYYYEKKDNAELDNIRLRTDKSHIVQIRDNNYQLLKDSL